MLIIKIKPDFRKERKTLYGDIESEMCDGLYSISCVLVDIRKSLDCGIPFCILILAGSTNNSNVRNRGGCSVNSKEANSVINLMCIAMEQ